MGSKRNARTAETTTFLTVDLEVVSKQSLAPLVAALDPVACALHCDVVVSNGLLTVFELNEDAPTAEGCLLAFSQAIQSLPAEARALWDASVLRVFDVGVQGGTREPAFHQEFSLETLLALSALRASLAFTVYPATTL